jgi:DNA-binding NarL/FixJ family response regulator
MTRVFIVSNHLMFSHGLESLLRRETKLDVVGQEVDEQKAIERIKELRPHVVILDSNGPPAEPVPTLIRILQESPGTQVIGLSLQNNTLHLYQATQRVVTSLEDLTEIISRAAPVSEIANFRHNLDS